jgi:hypothetical protein
LKKIILNGPLKADMTAGIIISLRKRGYKS